MPILSIYYKARRQTPLSEAERAAIREVERQFAVEDQIARRELTGDGPNWESFCVYDPDQPPSPRIIFEGATGLPDNSEEHLATGLEHWCNALAAIRRILPDAEWSVHINDVDIPWDEKQQVWDPWAAHPDDE